MFSKIKNLVFSTVVHSSAVLIVGIYKEIPYLSQLFYMSYLMIEDQFQEVGLNISEQI